MVSILYSLLGLSYGENYLLILDSKKVEYFSKQQQSLQLQIRQMTMTASTRVKILFNSGSQRSYVTNNLQARLGLKSTKTETLRLNMFGETSFQKQKCEVLTLLLGDLNDETSRSFSRLLTYVKDNQDKISYTVSNSPDWQTQNHW